jgi:23S rRNA (cytidine1920-2'-O)/16S rRNA (cytidine1409-2'-O)-methyltransferase
LKYRLDELLVLRNMVVDIETARVRIGAGEVFVNDTLADKAGSFFVPESHIRMKERCPFVSRGGLKLQAGLVHFDIDITDLVCLDVGASTGGFTDCLLQNGARKVYAVDVAYGQLDWKLRQDPRVVVLERLNARKLSPGQIMDSIDLAVLDASFISLTKLIPPILQFFTKNIAIIALIKPQFELVRGKVGQGGVVQEPHLHEEAINVIKSFALRHHLVPQDLVASPLLGPKGNREFLIYLTGDCANR